MFSLCFFDNTYYYYITKTTIIAIVHIVPIAIANVLGALSSTCSQYAHRSIEIVVVQKTYPHMNLGKCIKFFR